MKLIISLLALVSLNAFASELNDLTVSVEQNAEQVLVKVQTGMRNAMCALEVTEFTIKKPEYSGLKLKRALVEAGTIEVTFASNPFGICMQAFGPHKGSLTLTKGRGLPSVQSGAVYRLIVNGVEHETALAVE